MNDLKTGTPPRPVILVAQRTGPNGIELATVPFEPGMIVERCGKRYQVDKRGVQRKVK